MNAMIPCASLDEVRTHLDRLERELVRLIAERGACVRQAAGFKRSAAEVPSVVLRRLGTLEKMVWSNSGLFSWAEAKMPSW